MLGELEELTSSKTIEAPDDLAEYGLDEPECSISVTAEAETTIDIGGETSLDGLRYVSIGNGNVYLVSSDLLTNFSCGLYDLVSKEAVPDMSDLVSFTVETASGTLDIEYLEDSGLAYTDRYTGFPSRTGSTRRWTMSLPKTSYPSSRACPGASAWTMTPSRPCWPEVK